MQIDNHHFQEIRLALAFGSCGIDCRYFDDALVRFLQKVDQSEIVFAITLKDYVTRKVDNEFPFS